MSLLFPLRPSLCVVLAALWLSGAPAQARLLKVSREQAQALQVQTGAPQPAGEAGAVRVQGQVQWPTAGLRVLSAPVEAMVQQVEVGVGDAVPAHRVLVRLASPELVGWQRDLRDRMLQLEQARRVAERDAGLLAEGLVPAQRAQASRTALESAEAALHERQAQLQLAGVAPDAGLSGHAVVVAPTAGRIVEVWVQPGQRVAAGAPLLSVARPGPLWLVLQVPADLAARLQPGDTARVPGCPGPARVETLAPQVDPASQLRQVRAVWSEPPGCVWPGQRLEAEVQGGAATEPTWWVAASALVREGGRDSVYLQREGGYEAVPVQRLSQAADGRVQVRPLGERWGPQSRVVIQGAVALKGLAAGLSSGE